VHLFAYIFGGQGQGLEDNCPPPERRTAPAGLSSCMCPKWSNAVINHTLLKHHVMVVSMQDVLLSVHVDVTAYSTVVYHLSFHAHNELINNSIQLFSSQSVCGRRHRRIQKPDFRHGNDHAKMSPHFSDPRMS